MYGKPVPKIRIVVSISVAILLTGYFVASSFFSMSTWDKWHDWETITSVENSSNSMSAVLERNKHFGSEGYKPIIQVSLFENSGMRRVVWMSGEKSSPTISWNSDTELSIAYKHNLSSDYRPILKVDGIDYSVSLDMNLDTDSIFPNSWEGWKWEQTALIENPSAGANAIIQRGEHMDAAPIVRILLADTNSNLEEVWSGTEMSTKPKVTWLSANKLVISVIDFHSYSFYPAKKLNEKIYKVGLEQR